MALDYACADCKKPQVVSMDGMRCLDCVAVRMQDWRNNRSRKSDLPKRVAK